jgi:hypothetical protein
MVERYMQFMPIFRGISSSNIKDGATNLFWKYSWMPTINNDSFPRGFSFVIDEVILAQDFLTSHSLHGSFHLPISPEAMEELRELQANTAHVKLL